MSRLIDADKFILALMDASLSSTDEDTILDLIDGIPTATSTARAHAQWIEYPRAHYFKCSVCKYTVPYRKAALVHGRREYNFCPMCGAKMDFRFYGGAER